ncbi:hypothetical protein FGO68_gene12497 [Halteria grandinella]|uniref:Uncharacterized protein n=1 Tax=Halteria grandinella TaxID=5974 RepID=A0A8J8TB78_HALGN|nr:hypothetical protein FGO68_gene12497 [Halteria grandinella]
MKQMQKQTEAMDVSRDKNSSQFRQYLLQGCKYFTKAIMKPRNSKVINDYLNQLGEDNLPRQAFHFGRSILG